MGQKEKNKEECCGLWLISHLREGLSPQKGRSLQRRLGEPTLHPGQPLCQQGRIHLFFRPLLALLTESQASAVEH